MQDPLGEAPQVETRKAVTGIVVILAGLALIVAIRPSLWVTVAIIVGLIVTIMLHEFGHYLMAKRAGMKVTEFFLGFGPRIWSFRRGETEYGIKAIPAGGYVRIIGMTNLEEVDPEDEPRTYRQSTTGKKLSVVLAGIAVNLIIFVLLVFMILSFNGQPELSTTLDQVAKGSPAAAAGIRSGDQVVSIDGRAIDSWDELGEAVRPRAGEPIEVVVTRDGVRRTVEVTPEDIEGAGRIGVVSRIVNREFTVPEAGWRSVTMLWTGTEQVGEALGRVFSPTGVERYSRTVVDPDAKNGISAAERPRSVIGIVADGDDMVGGNVWALLALIASINLFLALLNAIPLPPLDGGHAAVAIYEWAASKVTGRRVQVDYRRVTPVAAVVIVFLLMFGLSAMYLDIRGL
jgi:membrane-associated protease RseP (regulator of RpoE activity)